MDTGIFAPDKSVLQLGQAMPNPYTNKPAVSCMSMGFHQASSLTSAVVLAKPVTTLRNLAHYWRETQGSNDWENLLKPLNPILRDEIIRYGEFVVACYEALDLYPSSRRYLNCKFGKKRLLREVGLEEYSSCYEVTKYIYATPEINFLPTTGDIPSRWIGYIGVSSDKELTRLGRRDVMVAFRGTVASTEWAANCMSSLTPARFDPHNPRPEVKVMSGALGLYTSTDSTCRLGIGCCRQQLLSEVSRIISKHKDEEMSITLAGHSIGSSLSLLLGYDLAELGLNRDGSNRQIPITVYSFGGPRVGNSGFKERCDELSLKVLRVVNVNDPITKLPGAFLNEKFRAWGGRYKLPLSSSCYVHVGIQLVLDFFKMDDLSCVHDMGTYVRMLRSCTEPKLI